jgi:hypothetical protein
MRAVLWGSIGSFVLALGACGLVLFSSGVPYHDGPNSGHVNRPGFWREIETSAGVLFFVGAGALAIALVGLGVFFVSRARRKSSKPS